MHAGVDGCPKGWLAVWGGDPSRAKAAVFADIKSLWADVGRCSRVLIDIPIGLPVSGDRACDTAARKLLRSPRASSIFPAPCREALGAGGYEEAKATNQRVLGKGLTRQAWAICPKIREVDEFIRSTPAAKGVLRESHPEVCYCTLTGGHPARHSKSKLHGLWERLAILKAHWPEAGEFFQSVRAEHSASEVGDDDILDAMALFVVACSPVDRIRTLPPEPEPDAHGLPMEMVTADPLHAADPEAAAHAQSASERNHDEREIEILSVCALRFAGYQFCYDIHLVDGEGPGTHRGAWLDFLKRPDFGKSPDYLRMILYFIQRSWKEGWVSEGDAELGIARSIFLLTAHLPVAPQYCDAGWGGKWDRDYAPRLKTYVDMIREKHKGAKYRPHGVPPPLG